jgi:signal transduction histidine kinase
MNIGIKWRLAALGSGAALMGILIAVVTVDSQRRSIESRKLMDAVDTETFRMTDDFRQRLRAANDQMRRYASVNDDPAWDRFLKARQQLRQWIEDQRPKVTEDREQKLLGDMLLAFASYEKKAEELHTRMEAVNEPGASLTEYNGFFEQSRRLLDAGEALTRAHFESRQPILAHARQTMARLRYSILGLVGLLFVFGAALVVGVYKYLIAPLRVKLVESLALVERNEKLASLGLLAAGVAHEIRTPLTAIKTGLYLQRKRLRADSPEHDDAQAIEGEISRLERIVNEFLHFARPSAPKLETILAERLLVEVQALVSPQLAASETKLLRDPADPLHIRVDPGQIKEVLLTLVQNAADSIGRGGTITLRARRDRRSLAQKEAEVVVLEVADTGKGIPPEVEKRLFDPFFTTKDSGAGLGLSIAARIVAVNGGALQYQTQVNHGSTFGIVLPRAA